MPNLESYSQSQLKSNWQPDREPAFDLVIFTNAPGEIATWVYPVWSELQPICQRYGLRVSVILSPCPHANGTEAEIIRSWGVDRVLGPKDFWDFLISGKTPDWDWYQRGAVLFLGGDQLYPVWAGKRLGYQILVYAEWTARWLGFIDGILARSANVPVPVKYQHKLTVVGDLMLCRSTTTDTPLPFAPDRPLIVLMPGSKHHKLTLGVPLFLGTAYELSLARPDLQFAIPLAPTITAEKLITYAPDGFRLDGDRIILPSGQIVHLYAPFPATNLLAKATLCITTIGANTAELASLGIPMLVVLPTGENQISNPVAWDGIWGLINQNPTISRWINQYMVSQIRKRNQKLAWPNIWAKREIVPELWGNINPQFLANTTLDYLQDPTRLAEIRTQLLEITGSTQIDRVNAAQKIREKIIQLMT